MVHSNLNILNEYSTNCASHWGHQTNKIPATKNLFSNGGG